MAPLNAGRPVSGAVLCGGRSSRFGTDKALADAAGVPMGLRVANAMRHTGADPVVAVGGTAGAALGLITVPDRHPDQGPLGGLATVLRWAGEGLVLVAPCDLPLLRPEHLAPLVAAATVPVEDDTPGRRAGGGRAAVAVIDERPQPMLACWPARWGRPVQAGFDEGWRTWRSALDAGEWIGVPLPPEAVADADTPEALGALLDPGSND
ncbi:MAG: molybdenum cofactor guanylyltransferase [Actinomycetota bacterium]